MAALVVADLGAEVVVGLEASAVVAASAAAAEGRAGEMGVARDSRLVPSVSEGSP